MDVTILNQWSVIGLILDAVIIIWLLASLISGAKNGFVASLLGMFTFLVAIIGAWILSGILADPLTKMIFDSPEGGRAGSDLSLAAARKMVRVGAAILSAGIIAVLFRILGKGLSRLINGIPLVGGLNQVLGLVVSALVTLALIMALLLAWSSFFPSSYEEVIKGAPVAAFVEKHNLLAQLFH
ncbi:MAG: CvpA family protein [Lachnospiraceae bacterium]|nr:CvpA family protein [Lachnospiraceae bacterium]